MVDILRCILFLSLFVSGKSVYSLHDDRNKIAHLAANSADLNQQTHYGEYLGKVTFDQGTTHLRAVKAITKGNAQNKLTFAIAFGDKNEQAHYWSQPEIDKAVVHAFADEIRYYPERHFIELIGNAKVIQGDNSLTAEKITFDTLKQHVVSYNSAQKRTMLIFHPGKNYDAATR